MPEKLGDEIGALLDRMDKSRDPQWAKVWVSRDDLECLRSAIDALRRERHNLLAITDQHGLHTITANWIASARHVFNTCAALTDQMAAAEEQRGIVGEADVAPALRKLAAQLRKTLSSNDR